MKLLCSGGPVGVVVDPEALSGLQGLGFSELETLVYAFLLQESPATGYRIAQAVGKAVANTYKAIQVLQDRGAVIVEAGDTRLCRAVPPRELFAQLQSDVRRRCEQVAGALEKLRTPPEDERVYRLQTREQVLERAREMLRRCKQMALISAFPEPLAALREELEAASARGIGILLKAYRPVEVVGAHIVLSNEAGLMLESLPGQELDVVIDAEEHLLSMLAWEGEGVLQAIWSASVFLSYGQANGLYAEWDLTRLNGLIRAGTPTELLRERILERAYPLVDTPGFRRLLGGLREDGADPTAPVAPAAGSE